jgi:hypothetical protein
VSHRMTWPPSAPTLILLHFAVAPNSEREEVAYASQLTWRNFHFRYIYDFEAILTDGETL